MTDKNEDSQPKSSEGEKEDTKTKKAIPEDK